MAVTRYMDGLLSRLTLLDPVTFLSVPILFSMVAAAAAWLPAAGRRGSIRSMLYVTSDLAMAMSGMTTSAPRHEDEHSARGWPAPRQRDEADASGGGAQRALLKSLAVM